MGTYYRRETVNYSDEAAPTSGNSKAPIAEAEFVSVSVFWLLNFSVSSVISVAIAFERKNIGHREHRDDLK
jgi:hypothetical protein